MLIRKFATIGAVAFTFAPLGFSQVHYPVVLEPVQSYVQTNLTSNQSGQAPVTDTNLVNAWGLSRSSGSPWWVTDNGTGLSTLYDGTGATQGLVVTIPPADVNVSSTGTPTGTIFNGTTDFAIAPGKPAVFLFATEDGTISGWNPGVAPTAAVIAVNETKRAVFKGLTMAQASVNGAPLANYLYVANFKSGRVEVFDTSFNRVPAIELMMQRVYSSIPHGFAPFNVQNIGGNIYVTYAKQDSARHDEVDGAGLGAVEVFHPDGVLTQILQPGPWFNAPWGVVLASGDFGAFSHDVLIGNFGSGEILAFEPIRGSFKGKLRLANGDPIQIPGLWGISFGNGGKAGSATALYFASGPNGEQDGLLGMLTPVQNTAGNDQ